MKQGISRVPTRTQGVGAFDGGRSNATAKIILGMNKSFRFFLFSAPLFALPPCAALAAAISIPFTYERNIPFVAVQATNSPPMCFILDTGAPTTIVGSTTSERLKLGFYKSPRPGNDLATATTCGMGNAPAKTAVESHRFQTGRHIWNTNVANWNCSSRRRNSTVPARMLE